MSVEVTQDMPVEVSAPRTASNLPRPFGRYKLLYHLARGGMGEVYLAVAGDLRGFERVCVVKTVRGEYARETTFVERFLDEGKILTQLSHGHIAQTLDVGRVSGPSGDQYFVALEYVEGKDLAKLLDRTSDRGQRLPVPVALHVAIAVLDALDYAHKRVDREGKPLGLIHRDISPQNVLVSYDGDVKLIDFGNARTEVRRHATAAGIIFGKPGYIAPEQARGSKPDPRSDLYAVGVTLWEALSGKRLLSGDLDDFLPKLRGGKVRPEPLAKMREDVPAELDRILAKAMAPEREDRHADAATLRGELQGVLAAIAPKTGPGAVAAVMREMFDKEMAVERRLIAQLLERAPIGTSEPIEVPMGPALGTNGTASRYRLLRKLGEGAMGEVFAAEHVELGKVLALKILHRDFSQNHSFVERFRREARAVAKLGHPSIVQVTDFGETADGRVFFAMEKLEGESLEEKLLRDKALPEEMALHIAEDVCGALVAAHGEGIVHRDLKPDNVFLCADGTVKLLDFGVAKTMGLGDGEKLTRAGEIFGTPEYMAPEQAANREVDARTDLYAVGIMLYEMVTGTLPFQASSAVELLHAHIHTTPEPPRKRAPKRNIGAATERVILAAIEKDPARRFASAEVMAAEINAARHRVVVVPRQRAFGMYLAAAIVTVGALAAPAWGLGREDVPAPAPAAPAPAAPARVVTAVPAPTITAPAPPPPLPPPVDAVDGEAVAKVRPAKTRVEVPAPTKAELREPGRPSLREVERLLEEGKRQEARDMLRGLPRPASTSSMSVHERYHRLLVACGLHAEAAIEYRRIEEMRANQP